MNGGLTNELEMACHSDKVVFAGTRILTVTLSSMESEYVALTHSSKGIILPYFVVIKRHLSFQIEHTHGT